VDSSLTPSKGRLGNKADNLTVICEPPVQKSCGPRRPVTGIAVTCTGLQSYGNYIITTRHCFIPGVIWVVSISVPRAAAATALCIDCVVWRAKAACHARLGEARPGQARARAPYTQCKLLKTDRLGQYCSHHFSFLHQWHSACGKRKHLTEYVKSKEKKNIYIYNFLIN
jgi:hypothetical protein